MNIEDNSYNQEDFDVIDQIESDYFQKFKNIGKFFFLNVREISYYPAINDIKFFLLYCITLFHPLKYIKKNIRIPFLRYYL